MGQGRGGHLFSNDELGKLAGVAVAQVRPGSSDRESREDCWQIAYVAGLEAKAAAALKNHRTSSKFLLLAMRTAIYRQLHRSRGTILESDLQICA